MSETRTRDDAVNDPRTIPNLRIQLLGIELTLLGGILLVAVPLMGPARLVTWIFLLVGLSVTLFGTFR